MKGTPTFCRRGLPFQRNEPRLGRKSERRRDSCRGNRGLGAQLARIAEICEPQAALPSADCLYSPSIRPTRPRRRRLSPTHRQDVELGAQIVSANAAQFCNFAPSAVRWTSRSLAASAETSAHSIRGSYPMPFAAKSGPGCQTRFFGAGFSRTARPGLRSEYTRFAG